MSALDYTRFFTNLKSWAFWTCVGQFVVFLLAFLILCAGYNFMILQNEDPTKDVFISNYEHYLTLASALLLLVPFGLSLFLIFAFLTRNSRMLNIWVKASATFSVIYFCSFLGSGIYLAVAGSVYISYIAIAISIIFCVAQDGNC